jgi:uncharacterized protein YoaH (UPF0181 family)
MSGSSSKRSKMSSTRPHHRAGATVCALGPDPAGWTPDAPRERSRLPGACRRILAASLVLLIGGIASGSATRSVAQPAAPSAPASGTDAAEAPLDICALFPRAVMERALGRIERTRSLNITRSDAPMRTPGGSGGCLWEGQGWRQVRLEVHTAAGLARQGLGSPRQYIDLGWPVGPGAAAVEGLGEVARLRPATGQSIELVAGSADRAVHLMAEGLARDQAVAIVRAALEQMRLR